MSEPLKTCNLIYNIFLCISNILYNLLVVEKSKIYALYCTRTEPEVTKVDITRGSFSDNLANLYILVVND